MAPPEAGADFERLAHAIELLSATRNPAEVIEIVRRSARGLSGARGVAVVLRDEDRCHYLAEDSDAPLWAGQKFPVTACISGWTMLNRRAAVVPDIFADPRIPHDAYRPTYVRSLIMTPVGDEAPFAAIGAYWDEVREHSPEVVNVLAALARSAATAFKNIQLYNSLRQEAERYDELYRQALQSERRLQVMVNELNHRVKNSLAMVQAIAAQSFRAAGSATQAQEALSGRIQALAAAHDVLNETRWEDADLHEIVQGAVGPYLGESPPRITMQGPPLRISPKAAICLSMTLHELATNAVKYGSLSNDRGTVKLVWALCPNDDAGPQTLTLDWTETGGPPVNTPERSGFGMRLLRRGLPADLNGTVDIAFALAGLTCRITAQIDAPPPMGAEAWR
ncbi:MAG TPA: HWE histidine kinase domain-containing protein [Caulobacteraceae bacterium]|nr:HWE histidine kinase domain-containing protein [Caulobacteraceae bacterium]